MRDKILNHFKGNFQAFYRQYLPEIKKAGTQYKAICPFPSHNDKKPSFNFSNEIGTYHCFGCGKKGDIFHFYAKINSKGTKRDFAKILKGIASDFGIPWEEKKSRIVKTYDYTDIDGDLLFQVCRMEPKDFRQRRPDGKNGWIWNLKGIRPVLYRLPEIQKAQEVIVTEGEKDVDCANEMGFTGTTCAMGARKWRDEYNEVLKGKDIVLIPDNDTEGFEHMTQVAISLNGTAKSLKWIDLPGLPSKGDLSNWVEKLGDREEAAERLAIMIDRADFYEPPKKATLENAVLEISEFSALNLPEKRQLLYPWLKENSINLISGWRGTGKTWIALSLLDSVSNEKTFGPWECRAAVPCLFLDGEMPTSDILERIRDLGLNLDRKNPLYIYSDAYANQLGLPRAHLGNESWRTAMKRILTTRKIKLWVIDNLASLASGLDENSKKDWDPINSWLLELRFAGISTIMCHHVNKEGGQRGTSAREDNLDISLMLKLPHDYIPEDGARFIVHFTKARVSTKDLQLISDTEFKLIQDEETERYIWTFGGVKRQIKAEVIKMLDEGSKTQEIADVLGISKGRVSQVKKQAVNDGHLSKEGKLTQEGFLFVHGSD